MSVLEVVLLALVVLLAVALGLALARGRRRPEPMRGGELVWGPVRPEGEDAKGW